MDIDCSLVDRERAELIQRVSLVMPVADVLKSKGMLSNEAFSEIAAEKTPQAQMRALYRHLDCGGHAAKTTFYHALKDQNRFLIEDLERTFKNGETSHNRQEPSEISVEVEEPQNLETIWHKSSEKWQRDLTDLLKDSDRQSVGNGKLFLCTKTNKYKIGAGADGTIVYLGIKADGTEVAIKRMVKANNEQLKNEISHLRLLESKYIVRYVDFVEGEDFNYLALQLCEYDLEKYRKEKLHEKGEEDKMKVLKKLAREVLLGLQVVHDAGMIHRDIKPNNVLIDVEGKARLADFGISRILDGGESTRCTSRVGTEGWEAAEILENEEEKKCAYNKKTDIQVAGMLLHYILSDGFHPFGKHIFRMANIANGKYSLHEKIEKDVEAKDLIEGMLPKDPEKRLKIEEAVDHPYFWDDHRRNAFLRDVGDVEAVQRFRNVDKSIAEVVATYTTFSGWKSKISEVPQIKPPDKNLPDDLLGLLRHLRNLLVHNKKAFDDNNMFKDLFPDFFISAHKLAKTMGWIA
ncbi:serine/threonine-protein kinase/endoribonuclease ire-1-like [Pygocentrus nattereri]|uniref:serine/threonine-protein kinase/endoribonuclease ire-1-like n=1 Tax=Pygocentrus nattereri TaxID=42514 RepID=UPI0008143951|nr:serine/threonine-protein kinase/endoribonuclease ire-1-like [Pygocentrus nattereri]XP_037400417.1 serine/threonine-protein kinase/endoribonuclease ire-1-like [Pygocentrus nattereri]XP_037400418.1 serine/threonine-protein kinase/endoribonuclease ire-1-like [Pygocentrus nattereri]XP_037400419.1 serine/threonine-protein kinase/endoribonuclease ire-1-like [Pygocentrus nattereri]XP_037400420.1 serine/threonine-protein kinase/endoribonuclease ire-1-like [Pygocentrus nattereri]XP_037400421.1 serin